MSEEIVKVTLLEEHEKRAGNIMELSALEQMASRLVETEKILEELKVKLADAQEELEEFKSKSQIERRLSELTGIPFKDLSPELEQKAKSLQMELENLSSERNKLRSEILSGLSKVILPIETNGYIETAETETFFKYRGGNRYPSITAFIKSELKMGNPPVYVTLNPEGIRVVGLTERTAAVKELVEAIENLRTKAAEELGHQTHKDFHEKPTVGKELDLTDTKISNILKKVKKS
ncbi:MAG: hypothetical protein QXN87_05400 [Candidatus Bathyarchaeia archaeon]